MLDEAVLANKKEVLECLQVNLRMVCQLTEPVKIPKVLAAAGKALGE